MVNEIGAVDNLRLENQLTELTALVRQLAVGQHQPIITARHPTNMCPTLQKTKSDHLESVGEIGGYQYGKQSYQIWPFDNQQAKSRAICSTVIWTYPECTTRSTWLSTTDLTIPGTTVPIASTTESSNSRQLTISRRPDEAVSNEQPGVLANHEL
ncbi:hypothetical protein CR513_32366, partial [Mucuna pruriens]